MRTYSRCLNTSINIFFAKEKSTQNTAIDLYIYIYIEREIIKDRQKVKETNQIDRQTDKPK